MENWIKESKIYNCNIKIQNQISFVKIKLEKNIFTNKHNKTKFLNLDINIFLHSFKLSLAIKNSNTEVGV